MVSLETAMGTIRYNEEIIAKIAGIAAESCYGIVGMSAKKASDGIFELLNRENYSKGIKVTVSPDHGLVIDMYVVVEYEVPMAEVAASAIDAVKYQVESTTGLKVEQVNVIVENVRV